MSFLVGQQTMGILVIAQSVKLDWKKYQDAIIWLVDNVVIVGVGYAERNIQIFIIIQ